MHLESLYFFGFEYLGHSIFFWGGVEFRVILLFWVVEICSRTSIPVKEMLVCPPGDALQLLENSLAVLRDTICDLENHFESGISSLKSETKKIRSKNTNVNERCGKMEKCTKENKILLEKVEDNMKVIRLFELKDELDSTHATLPVI